MSPFPVSVDPRALKLGYSETFNVGFTELTPNTRLEVSYVATAVTTSPIQRWRERNPHFQLPQLVNAIRHQRIQRLHLLSGMGGPSPSTYGVPCPSRVTMAPPWL